MPDQRQLDLATWRKTLSRWWRLDMRDGLDAPISRLLRVESRGGDVISSGKFFGRGYPDNHWRCTAAAPAVKWMEGLTWRKASAQLRRTGYEWVWL